MQDQPPTNQPTSHTTETPSESSTPLILSVLILMVFIAIGAYAYGRSLSSSPATDVKKNQNTNTSVDPSQLFQETESTDKWKTFNSQKFIFQYPQNWSISTVNPNANYDYVQVTNPEGTVAACIVAAEHSLAWGSPGTPKTNQLDVIWNNELHAIPEIVVDGQGTLAVLELEDKEKHRFIFGTNSPQCYSGNYSLTDYEKQKKVILKMLSTIKFSR
ncbi:MAG: hypothetical protein ABIO02_00015 [Patescibacteria group bacterium]